MLAVIGGTALDSALDPVVALVTSAGDAFCTGVVVAPDWVLTAAHCATAAEALEAPTVVWAAEVSDPAEVRGWTEAVRHPDADEATHAHDLALLALDAPAPGSVAALGDAPPAVGDALAVYGFGTPVEGLPADGVKRGAVLAVEEVADDVLLAFSPDANACSGDSGGPAVAERGGGWVVVGIDTFVDPACLGGRTGSTRIDTDLGWLADVVGDLALQPITPAPSAPPRGCATTAAGAGATLGGMWLSRRRPSRCGAKAAVARTIRSATRS